MAIMPLPELLRLTGPQYQFPPFGQFPAAKGDFGGPPSPFGSLAPPQPASIPPESPPVMPPPAVEPPVIPAPAPEPPPAAALPPNTAPTSAPFALTPPQGAGGTPDVPETSLLGRLGSGIGRFATNNPMTLLALGAGLSGAQNLGQGLSRGFAAAVPAMQADVKQRNINETVEALKRRGLPEDVALAAASNPAIMQQIIGQVFGPKAYQHVTVKGPFGEDIPMSFDPTTRRYFDMRGQPVDTGTPGAGPASNSFLAAGVTAINHNLIGDDYLKQFSPELQAGVRDFIAGRQMPTGNPRQGFTQAVKMVAQKYGSDIGMPADDTTFTQRRQLRNELAKGTPGSLGGQITFGGTSLGHLADVAEKATHLENVSGFGVAPIAHLFNQARGLFNAQAAKVNEVSGAVQHYGQEITKFYTGSPGGEGERTRFLRTMDTAKSPQEIAGAIRTERDLIPDRLNQIQAQISERLGPEGAKEYQVLRGNARTAIERINRALAKLDPNGPEAQQLGAEDRINAPPASTPATPGVYNWSPNTGAVRIK